MPQCEHGNIGICNPICLEQATYDAKTSQGPWGFLCDKHYKTDGSKVHFTKLK